MTSIVRAFVGAETNEGDELSPVAFACCSASGERSAGRSVRVPISRASQVAAAAFSDFFEAAAFFGAAFFAAFAFFSPPSPASAPA